MKARARPIAICLPILITALSWSAMSIAKPAPLKSEPAPLAESPTLIHSGAIAPVKAAVDTTLLLGPHGSGATYIGTFEDPAGNPAWNGWTGVDRTDVGGGFWHADTYNVVSGAYSAWCGETRFSSCEPGDPDGGYGNLYNEVLEWRGAVTDINATCLVNVTALANHNVEPGYDACYLSFLTSGGQVDAWFGDGQSTGVSLAEAFTYQPGDYVDGEVVVQFRVTSDEGWSDEDCSYPSDGAMQLDDVVITLDNGTGTSHDFEDGTLGPFTTMDLPGVGNFAKIWTGLGDLDPCLDNFTPQVAFIDDGIVVPGTGGSVCINWCYGPGGYIVSTTGGLLGSGASFVNAVESPPMAWPDPSHDSALLSFDAYRHEDLSDDSAGIFFLWEVRSVNTGDPADLVDAPWLNRGFQFFGGPEYTRYEKQLWGLLMPGVTHVQVALVIRDGDFRNGDDGYPAPYFDNVRFQTYSAFGPVMSVDAYHLSQDGFPESREFDPLDPGAASVRFDMVGDITRNIDLGPTPGDSVVIDVVTVRSGAVMDTHPRMHYRLRPNPDFDPYRTSGLPTVGSVVCDSARSDLSGNVVEGKWFADLPDTGFLFPGDELHYYFEASDRVGEIVETALLPADTTGFSDFADPWAYHRDFSFVALPSVRQLDPDTGWFRQPELLIWIDGATDTDWDRWTGALDELCLERGFDYDLYRTSGEEARNGLGDRSSAALVAGYNDIVYTSCGLTANTLGDGSSRRESPDVQVLSAWLDLGDRDLVAFGDHLAKDLDGSSESSGFLRDRLGVNFVADDISPLIGGQTAPRIVAASGQPFFRTAERWAVDAACPDLKQLDAVEALPGTERRAEYADWSGLPGGFPYAAATLLVDGVTASRTVLLPYGLANVVPEPGGLPYWNRSEVLADILGGLGANVPNCISGVVSREVPPVFSASIHPNPFNPTTRISYTVALPGRLEVKIYDLRGRLVRTLFDGQVTTSGFVDWHGDDARGANVASGVYFYEVRMGDEVTIAKMALIR